MDGSGVVADLDAIRRRLASDAAELHLLFRDPAVGRTRSLAEAMAAARDAMAHANNGSSAETVWGQAVEPSPHGPVVFLDATWTRESNDAWVGAFAERLTRDGWSGSVTPAPLVWSEGPAALATAVKPAAFLAFRLAAEPPPGTIGRWGPPRWAVDAGTTAALCRYLADWAALPGGAVELTMGRSTVAYPEPDVAERLAWAAGHDHDAGVTCVGTGSAVLRHAALGSWGQVTCQVGDGGPDWRARVEHLRGPLAGFADRLDVAFVRTGHSRVTSWFDLAGAVPAPPHVTAAKVRLNRRLWAGYVPDAHGIQVLTDGHLSRLGPLPGWDVRPLGGGRHLVQARDLEPWFATPNPTRTWWRPPGATSAAPCSPPRRSTRRAERECLPT